jgi:hypothetical protein
VAAEADTASIAHALRLQSRWCEGLGSPLYAALLEESARDVEAGGPVAALLAGHQHDPLESALALRLMGAVHRLVLAGEAPALAAHYPSAGGDGHRERAWKAFRALVGEQAARLRPLIDLGLQTNEVRRSCVLAPGLLWIARETGLPLRCLEIGASAGLNLRWDHYRYDAGDVAWGDPAAPLRFTGAWIGGRPPFDVTATVAERRGCDRAPLDPTSPADRLTLAAYMWADQRERAETLARALEVASHVPAPIDAAEASAWLAAELATPRPGRATVVFHSVVWQYLPAETRQSITDLLDATGSRAAPDAPLAWLRLEPGGAQAELRCTCWPDGTEQRLATSGFHGQNVRWLAD